MVKHLLYIFVFMLCLSLFLTNNIIALGSTSNNSASISVKINDKTVKFKKQVILSSNVIQAPAEELVKFLGAHYKYSSKSITITKSKTTIVVKINSKTARINGKEITMPIACKLIKVPYMPVQFIGKYLGYKYYNYDIKKKIVDLWNYKPKPTATPTPEVLKNINIYLAGDSTVATYDNTWEPLNGWGSAFGQYFKSNATVLNKAIGGRSSKSYIDEGHLTEILDVISAGDYLFIQFGANDSRMDPASKYYTDPQTTYKDYLVQYINGVREHNAIPILVTSVNKRIFNSDGTVFNDIGGYPQAMIEVGQKYNVPVIDLFSKSKALFESLGPEKTKKLFVFCLPGEYPKFPYGAQEDTHFNNYGANEIAKLVVQGVREKLPTSLAKYLLP